jgi:hypothetical protein
MAFIELTDSNWLDEVNRDPDSELLIAFRSKEPGVGDLLDVWLAGRTLSGKLRVARMYADESREAQEALGVLSVPNWIVLKGGVDRRAGCIGPWLEKPEKKPTGLPIIDHQTHVDERNLSTFLKDYLVK